jgi:hypothetical protein
LKIVNIYREKKMSSTSTSSSSLPEKCIKRAGYGGLLGSFVGVAVGVVDSGSTLKSFNIVDWNSLKTNIVKPEVSRLLAQRQIEAVGFLGLWSACFQLSRCALEPISTFSDPIIRTMTAFTICTFPFVSNRQFRRILPWTVALTAMDLYHGGLKNS